ncbi:MULTISPECIES: Smr/MutS family protein [unclassified Massilia]|uniref:Smr/MutS family protein n=1 Tax=unclassified Massilia TaxID=2609279 RepID=UPI001B816183|nr:MULTISPECIES: Smr/MutS family protein [unclassified Massilia]MBQ5942170.1 Smr/MutS family protein [Massilia sp. AB1]MBQ5965769.1 Smr/MutS family protein [Massilia sp. ZL223]
MAGMKDFSELKGLRDKLKEDERLRAIEKAEREKRERIARERAVEFRSAMQDVKKMPESNRYVHRPVYVAPNKAAQSARPLTPEEETEAVLRESLSDQFDVEGLLDEDPTLSYAQDGVGPDVVRKLRKRHWPVQDELDLHGMNRDEARDALTDFLHRANKRGVRCVRVIHGIGYGSPKGEPVLRGIVHSWLVQKSEVIAFCVAGKTDGGHGALIVLLRPALDY